MIHGAVQAPFRAPGIRSAAVSRRSRTSASTALLLLSALAAGCGGNGGGGTSAQTTSPTTTPAPASSSPTTTGPNALVAEAQQTAAGDIPDNQVFLRFRNSAEGYSIKYPEGWAQRGSAGRVTFQDKNNLVRIQTAKGSRVTVAGASAEMARLRRQTTTLRFDPPTRKTVGGMRVVKVVYSTESAPNPVTGKRVKLVVDRYYVAGTGKHAVVDLGTPQGVDNVDAYRLMIQSFRWG
jgi:hypothetical protein